MEKKEQKPDKVQFRCDPAIIEEFEKNLGSRGWSVPVVGRLLLESVNALFRKKKRPEWPLLVVDATDVSGEDREPTQQERENFRAFMAEQFSKHLDDVRAIIQRESKSPSKRAASKATTINPASATSQDRPTASRKPRSA